ncbi:MAG: hypothetical protein O3A10_00015 [Chloroflexi bacterium]|nr:hypothetical protein [Chloroflexota bacterium]MDA1145344.1 hypothetical protein [Chloroflexota bacterium]
MASSERDPDEYVARGATIADGPEMLRVLVAAFGRWPEVELACSALDYLDWKMAAPGITPWHHTVVTRADHVVAVTLTWVADGQLNGTPTAVSHTVDLAVDPAHQGHGLGRMIQQRARGESVLGEIGMDLISKSDAVGHMYAADEIVERPLHTWVRPISARATAARGAATGQPTSMSICPPPKENVRTNGIPLGSTPLARIPASVCCSQSGIRCVSDIRIWWRTTAVCCSISSRPSIASITFSSIGTQVRGGGEEGSVPRGAVSPAASRLRPPGGDRERV